jgi:hypothetical protein
MLKLADRVSNVKAECSSELTCSGGDLGRIHNSRSLYKHLIFEALYFRSSTT